MSGSAKHDVRIVDFDLQFACPANQSLLRGMERVAARAIPVGCRNGGCGVCKIEVLSGSYEKGRMSRACVSAEEEENGVALACKVFPQGDLTVRVLGKMGRKLAPAHTPAAR
ncbi:2Fe-2S iron-sulfur cluster binding domain-containing protein [Novosphingobium malaysiense]|uniref:2Fe-2S iron-sulfur cluster binding domain-containing protein n=1 Tax=Novosphingobium malaysiense TaxID=1348853 RepID=UPI001E29DCC8|nr:2Fe-2S iron-sulfur cluster binding domain-containing protein [Novosphingobium malaysiense]